MSAAASSVEQEVRSRFVDAPVMVEVARCESGLRQHNADGSVLRGGWGRNMIGVFQIFEDVHRAPATALGYDIDSLEGNVNYARHLYDTQGTTPWNSAKHCWASAAPTLPAAALEGARLESLRAQIAQLQQLIVLLQQLLELKRAA